jgi:hypothetical protein
MLRPTNALDTSVSSLNTHVEEPGKGEELSRTLTPHTFSEVISNNNEGRGWKDEEAGDALDGEVNESMDEKRMGPDPFMVVFEPGDPENPKVKREGRVFMQRMTY